MEEKGGGRGDSLFFYQCMIALFLLYNLCRKMLTLCYVMCTVGTVINKHEQEMKEVNKYDAPEGYVAVEPRERCGGVSSCRGCFFRTTSCLSVEISCFAEDRADGQDVLFIKKHEEDINY